MKTLVLVWLIGIEVNLIGQLCMWCACYSVVRAAETGQHTNWSRICFAVLKAAGVTAKECANTVYNLADGLIAIGVSIIWPITWLIGLLTK